MSIQNQAYSYWHADVFPLFSANNNGVHRNVISQQLNLPMDKLMSLSLSLSVMLSLLSNCLQCKMGHHNVEIILLAFDREVLESLNENSLVNSIDEFHYKSAVNA